MFVINLIRPDLTSFDINLIRPGLTPVDIRPGLMPSEPDLARSGVSSSRRTWPDQVT